MGAGSAGRVLADRLSASGKHRVLLLEGERFAAAGLPVCYHRITLRLVEPSFV